MTLVQGLQGRALFVRKAGEQKCQSREALAAGGCATRDTWSLRRGATQIKLTVGGGASSQADPLHTSHVAESSADAEKALPHKRIPSIDHVSHLGIVAGGVNPFGQTGAKVGGMFNGTSTRLEQGW